MKLGIFDSGIGGEAVAAALQDTFPAADIITVNDRIHVPYGNRDPEEITRLTDAAIQPLLKENCDVIILACNSATSAAIEKLRDQYPSQKFIGLEPMVKPAAAMTKSNVIAVCATPATLASERYRRLKNTYGSHVTILEPDCRRWAQMIEDDQLDYLIIQHAIEDACEQGADVIVLACTHYHWIKELIQKIAASRAVVIDPSDAIGRRVETLTTSIR